MKQKTEPEQMRLFAQTASERIRNARMNLMKQEADLKIATGNLKAASAQVVDHIIESWDSEAGWFRPGEDAEFIKLANILVETRVSYMTIKATVGLACSHLLDEESKRETGAEHEGGEE